MDTNATGFWRRVNSLIKAQHTKQEAIATECNISYQTFRGWIARKTFPGGDETYRVAQALKTTVEYLITGEQPEQDAAEQVLDKIQAAIDQHRNHPSRPRKT